MTPTPTLVPVQTRDERPASIVPSDFAAITGREYEWHLTPITRIAGLLSDELAHDESGYDVVANGPVTTGWVSMNDELVGRAGTPDERASAVAWSSANDAFLVDVGADDVSEVTLTRRSLDSTPKAAHTVIRVAPFSKTTIVLVNEGLATLAENVEILAGDSSSITVVSLQQWSADTQHLATHFIRTERAASVKHVVVSLSGDVVRVNSQAQLTGAGSSVELLGLYFADAGQHLEQQVFVNHVAEQTKSRVTYKGALQGEGARTVWIGDVLIGPQAVGTDSYEQNRNLVLTDGTRADSIPNLEIKTGDIAGAGHASATGRFDDEQLFYLQARGISEDEARQLVVRGFLNEVVQQIGVPEIEERIQRALDAELSAVSVSG
jgi:Fe-S cluster assembly protein SufD